MRMSSRNEQVLPFLLRHVSNLQTSRVVNGHSKSRLLLFVLESFFENFKISIEPYLHLLIETCIRLIFDDSGSLTDSDDVELLKTQAASFLAKIVNKWDYQFGFQIQVSSDLSVGLFRALSL